MALSADGQVAWFVEVRQGGIGTLVALDVATGQPRHEVELVGAGQRYTVPLIADDRVYLTSCAGDGGPSHVEGYELVPASAR